MLAAISRGDQVTLQRMLSMNTSPNFTYNGTTPLHLAAERGYPEMVRILISYGADYRKKNAQGMTALEIALTKKKFIITTEILHNASRASPPNFGQNETRRFEADMWQKQHSR
jgi:ankyrin repeat protein